MTDLPALIRRLNEKAEIMAERDLLIAEFHALQLPVAKMMREAADALEAADRAIQHWAAKDHDAAIELMNAHGERLRMKDALEAQAKDAARYRWLRQKRKIKDEIEAGRIHYSINESHGGWGQHLYEDAADASIDAAMAEERKE